MPIYEYRCEDCGEVTEVLVRNTRTQVNVECKSCKSNHVSRMISAPGAVRVKGGAQAVPPMSCPNQGNCGMPHGSCPAAQPHHHHH